LHLEKYRVVEIYVSSYSMPLAIAPQ